MHFLEVRCHSCDRLRQQLAGLHGLHGSGNSLVRRSFVVNVPGNPVTFAEDVQIADVVDFSIRVDVVQKFVGDVLDAVTAPCSSERAKPFCLFR